MTRRCLAAALALLAVVASAGVEDRRWCRTTTEHFDLVTDLGLRKSTALLVGLDLFRTAAYALLPGRPLEPPATPRLLAFKRAQDFMTLFDLPNVVGFMQPSLQQSLLAFGPDRTGRHLHTFAYHEYTHFLLRSRTTLNLPAWYEEGLATYLANLQVDEDGMVTVGRGPHALLRFLVKHPQTRFERVVDGRFRLGVQHHELSHPYALAWGVVRFLHHAKRPDGSRYAEDLGAMLAAIDGGATSANAMRELGIAIADLPGLIRAYYAAEGQRPATVFRFEVGEYEPPTPKRECLDDIESRLLLAEAVARQRPAKAAALYDAVLARQPRHVGALVGRSAATDDLIEARRYAQAALDVDAEDAPANIRMAQIGMTACETLANAECGRELAAAAGYLERALETDGKRTDAIYRLGVLYLLRGAPDEALAHMLHAYARAPWSPRVNYYLGQAYRLGGDVERAKRHLEKTANWHPDPAWRSRAERIIERMDAADQRPAEDAVPGSSP